MFIDKYNLTTQKFNWNNNNIKLPEFSKEDICYIELLDKNIDVYNNYFNVKKIDNNEKEINQTKINLINNHNKTIVIPKTLNSNKTIAKNTFLGNDKIYENINYFSFNIFTSPFSKGLKLFDHVIKNTNTSVNLKKTAENKSNQEKFNDQTHTHTHTVEFEKKDLIRLSFLGISSKKITNFKILKIKQIFKTFL